ncbi:E3 SUMO-protein ligase RanBP2-like [Sitodiplosis mosellana]|uniref:E3 SUMO-protein ligase RanBP2-like n=1 Tax=Sitodiplosis mosellana TaxID=263140 RepID=UPI002444525B|nr:E3 SUMO-protein ligase RanBP2-like [Sitodiplosis mosellana]
MEEHEEKMFGRATLYKFDSDKNWEKLGAGEFKVLYNPGNHSYRLLLRCDRIHKLVLNMKLTIDLQINPMEWDERTFVLEGQNFAEEQKNGQFESLKIRFKKTDSVKKFNDTIKTCLNELNDRSKQMKLDTYPGNTLSMNTGETRNDATFTSEPDRDNSRSDGECIVEQIAEGITVKIDDPVKSDAIEDSGSASPSTMVTQSDYSISNQSHTNVELQNVVRMIQ